MDGFLLLKNKKQGSFCGLALERDGFKVLLSSL